MKRKENKIRLLKIKMCNTIHCRFRCVIVGSFHKMSLSVHRTVQSESLIVLLNVSYAIVLELYEILFDDLFGYLNPLNKNKSSQRKKS